MDQEELESVVSVLENKLDATENTLYAIMEALMADESLLDHTKERIQSIYNSY